MSYFCISGHVAFLIQESKLFSINSWSSMRNKEKAIVLSQGLPVSHDFSLPRVPIFGIVSSARFRQERFFWGEGVERPAQNVDLKLGVDLQVYAARHRLRQRSSYRNSAMSAH